MSLREELLRQRDTVRAVARSLSPYFRPYVEAEARPL